MDMTPVDSAQHSALIHKAVWLRAVVFDLLFPPRCAGCGRVGTAWCATCTRALDTLPIESRERRVEDVLVIASGAHVGLLQEAVQGLKYHGLRGLAEPLGTRVADAVSRLGHTFDAVVAVPSPPHRLRMRGYNQAQLIADVTARHLGASRLNDALTRTRETRSQVGLTSAERRENVSGAFIAHADRVRGLRILIVDDVCTTGATLAACAGALHEGGAHHVMAATVTEATR